MVGSTGTLKTMRLVRSKLRKREESSSPVTVDAPEVVSSAEQHSAAPTSPTAYGQTPVWVFPPLPPQPNIIRTCGQVSKSIVFIIQIFIIFKVL